MKIEFFIRAGVLELTKGSFRLADLPFFLANKARAYSAIRKTGSSPWGGPVWKDLKKCEAAVRLAADHATKSFEIQNGKPWRNDLVGYRVELDLVFGSKIVEIRRANAKPYSRRDRAEVRRRKIGRDKAAQAILDGLQGPIYLDDERVFELEVRKMVRAGDAVGDFVRARVSIDDPPE